MKNLGELVARGIYFLAFAIVMFVAGKCYENGMSRSEAHHILVDRAAFETEGDTTLLVFPYGSLSQEDVQALYTISKCYPHMRVVTYGAED